MTKLSHSAFTLPGGWDLDCNRNGLPNDYNCYGIDGCYCGSNGQCQAVEQCKTHSNTRCSARDNNPDGGELVSYDEKLTMDECKDLCLERARQRGATADFCCDFGRDGSGHKQECTFWDKGTWDGSGNNFDAAICMLTPPSPPPDTIPRYDAGEWPGSGDKNMLCAGYDDSGAARVYDSASDGECKANCVDYAIKHEYKNSADKCYISADGDVSKSKKDNG